MTSKMKEWKKIIVKLGMTIMAVAFLLLAVGAPEKVDAAEVGLSGNGTIRAGDTLTVSMTVNHAGLYAIQGSMTYDSNVLELSSSNIVLGGWKVDWNGSRFVCDDSNLTSPTGGSATVLTFTFKVKSGAATGANAAVTVSEVEGSDGNADYTLGSASYSAAVSAPLSGNTRLSSLTVEGMSLNPGFSAGTTEYSLGEVEFATSKINVFAKAEDGAATVSIGNTGLAVGSNKITITVTAENGAKGYYTLSVNRKQDPNYIASNDSSLADITLSTGTLSPAFSSAVKSYIVYLPFEAKGTSFSAGGTATDGKAIGVDAGTMETLAEGNNKVVVTCKAEDGSTTEYVVNVYVMPAFAGATDNLGKIDIPADKDTTKEPEASKPKKEYVEVEKKVGVATGVFVTSLILILLIGGGIGFGVTYYLFVIRPSRIPDPQENYRGENEDYWNQDYREEPKKNGELETEDLNKKDSEYIDFQ